MASNEAIRNIGIIAHIDAGKTTVSERILYYSHKEHRLGEVDAGTAHMDWMPEEQERGITITAAATSVDWSYRNRDFRLNLIDTPGHVDFTAEVERALRVLDGAVGVFCGTAGVQAQSETVWRQASRYDVPRIAFVNKLDRVGSDFFAVVESMRTRLLANAIPVQIPVGREKGFEGVVDLLEMKQLRFGGSLGEELEVVEIADSALREEAERHREKMIEAAAEFDDELLEDYLSGVEVSADAVRVALRRATLALQLVPVFCGAALRNKGVQALLDGVCDFLPSPADFPEIEGIEPKTGKVVQRPATTEGSLLALAFKTVADPHGDLVYARVYGGTLAAGAQVWNPRAERRERAQKLYRMHANDAERLESSSAGDIVVIAGLKATVTGDTLCDPSRPVLLEPPRFPDTVVSMAIEPVSIADRDKLVESLEKLQREDPTFRWRADTETGQIVISGMGELHLEVLKGRLLREFNVAANVGTPRVSYRQTIQAAAEARGVFEQQIGGRQHFAAVRLRLEPDPELSQVLLESRLDKDAVPLEFHPAVEDGARGALGSGGVLGFPLTQVRAVVLDAEFRQGESSAMAYTAAASKAVDEALDVAGACVLEPVMAFAIEVPEEFYGAVSADVSQRRAVIQDVELERGLRVIRGVVPLAEVFGYPNMLRSLSQGRAEISLEPDSYRAVPADVAARFDW